MKDDKFYLSHILEAIEKIYGYIEGSSFDDFSVNNMMFDAVVRELEIIGEASSKLSDDFKNLHTDETFRNATDMRNFLIHGYFAVNKQIVWDTCHEDLPKLKNFIQDIQN